MGMGNSKPKRSRKISLRRGYILARKCGDRRVSGSISSGGPQIICQASECDVLLLAARHVAHGHFTTLEFVAAHDHYAPSLLPVCFTHLSLHRTAFKIDPDVEPDLA